MTKGPLVVLSVITASVALASIARAVDRPQEIALDAVHRMQATPHLTLNPSELPDTSTTDSTAQPGEGTSPGDHPVLTLDAGGTASRIHGFGDLRFATAYMTPRGVVVENQGLVTQPLAGLVFDVYQGTGPINDISLVAGIWSSLHTHHPGASLWNECDFFGTADVKFLSKWDLATTIGIWTYPGTPDHTPGLHTQYELDSKLSYDDSDMFIKGFAFNPYLDFFWDCGGHEGEASFTAQAFKTFYVEVGITPTYTVTAITNLPITLSMPTYIQVGDSSFWGDASPTDSSRSSLGAFSTGLKASVPLSFIPKDYGAWNAYVGVTYLYECNAELVNLSDLAGSGHDHNRVVGYAGIGFGF